MSTSTLVPSSTFAPTTSEIVLPASLSLDLLNPSNPPHSNGDCAHHGLNGSPTTKHHVVLGWRWIKDDQDPREIRRVELTAEDLLHPLPGDEVVNSLWHSQVFAWLHMLLRLWCSRIQGGLLLSDQGVKWRPGFGHSPDIVFFTNAPSNFDGTTLYLYETQARPQFVAEIVSHSTTEVTENDTVKKRDHYYDAGLPQYVLIDREEVNGVYLPKLTNYVRGAKEFILGEKNERGHIALNGTPYFLGEIESKPHQTSPMFGLFDADGHVLGIEPDLEEKLEAETQERIDAQKRAKAYETKLRELGIPLPEVL